MHLANTPQDREPLEIRQMDGKLPMKRELKSTKIRSFAHIAEKSSENQRVAREESPLSSESGVD